jgi:nucleotide-binding universal stress UspA family protein
LSTLKTKISKILAAVDGSESSMDAADYAILLAKQNNAQLIALHVARPGDAYRKTSTTDSVEVGTPQPPSPQASADSVPEAVKQEFQK